MRGKCSSLGLLKGRLSQNTTSWGGKDNLAWNETILKVSRDDLTNLVISVRNGTKWYKPRFYNTMSVKNGLCYNIDNYSTSMSEPPALELRKYIKFEVFLTDKKLATFGSLYHASQLQSVMEISFNEYREFEIVVEQRNIFDPTNPEACYDYKKDEYHDCVDQEAQKIFKPTLG